MYQHVQRIQPIGLNIFNSYNFCHILLAFTAAISPFRVAILSVSPSGADAVVDAKCQRPDLAETGLAETDRSTA